MKTQHSAISFTLHLCTIFLSSSYQIWTGDLEGMRVMATLDHDAEYDYPSMYLVRQLRRV